MRVNDFPFDLIDKRVEVVRKDRLNKTEEKVVGTLQPTVYRDGRVTFALEDVETSRFGTETFNVQEVDEINLL
jgi:hypothetical protein